MMWLWQLLIGGWKGLRSWQERKNNSSFLYIDILEGYPEAYNGLPRNPNPPDPPEPPARYKLGGGIPDYRNAPPPPPAPRTRKGF